MATPIKLYQGFNQQVVDDLEYLLEEAKKGEITSMVAVYKTGQGFATVHTDSDNLPELIGWLEILKQRQIERTEV